MAPFRYWGSKVRMAPWIVERLPKHSHWVESCCGSAAVTMFKPKSTYETVNDTYGEVVNFFSVLRDTQLCSELIDAIAFTPYAHSEFLAAGSMNDLDPLTRAWRFFIRMQMAVVPGRTGWSYGVNGESASKANKPGRWATMPEHLKLVAARFNRIQVTSWPVDKLLLRLDSPGTLHFVDPPYLPESRRTSLGPSSAYVDDSFDHDSFLKTALSTRHSDVLVTHYPHPFYDNGPFIILGDYISHRNIANKGSSSGREPVVERLYRMVRT